MAFLDETGLAELWSLIKNEDANVTVCKPLLDAVTTTGSYLATYTLSEPITNFKFLIVHLAGITTYNANQTSNDKLCFGTSASAGQFATITAAKYKTTDGSGSVVCFVAVGDILTAFQSAYGSVVGNTKIIKKSDIDDLTKITYSGNSSYQIYAGGTIKVWGLK